MFRYDKQGNPLVFENEDSVSKTISKFKARTVYATAGKYEEVTKDNIEKDYGKGYAPKYSKTTVPSEFRKDKVLANVVGEQVYQDIEKGYYIIGDKMQTPEDYDREIKDKIEPIISYDKAWDATIKYVSSFPKEVLENQREFSEKVYLPIRDKFIEKVINRKSGLDAFFSS